MQTREEQHIIWFELDDVDSTNTFLREHGPHLKGKDWACLATQQSQGKGRLQRQWQSPQGGLYLSWRTSCAGLSPLIFQPLAGIAVIQTLETYAVQAKLKWPNDVLTQKPEDTAEYKLGGILSEYLPISPAQQEVILGIGLNVNATIQLNLAQEPNSALPAIALADLHPNQTFDTKMLAQTLVRNMQAGKQKLLQQPEAHNQLLQDWRQACGTLGQQVEFSPIEGQTIQGTAVDIDDDFALVIETPQGPRTFSAGDCTHLRTHSV
ncbi:MAG: biotin--[acetyl-CoA-carboxylase] ligase [Myxococcota bacterium]